MAAAKALTIEQLGKEICASKKYAGHLHVRVEELKDWDEKCQKKKKLGNLCKRERKGRKHRSEQCKYDLGGTYKMYDEM